jgi:hypothetical protein
MFPVSESCVVSAAQQELAQIRTAAESLKAEVDFLRQEQAKSRAQEETLVLRELRRTVDALQAERDTIKEQAAAVRLCLKPLLAWYQQQHLAGCRVETAHGCAHWLDSQVEVAFEELTGEVKQQLAAQDQQKLEAHMSQVLEAVDLDKYLAGGLRMHS